MILFGSHLDGEVLVVHHGPGSGDVTSLTFVVEHDQMETPEDATNPVFGLEVGVFTRAFAVGTSQRYGTSQGILLFENRTFRRAAVDVHLLFGSLVSAVEVQISETSPAGRGQAFVKRSEGRTTLLDLRRHQRGHREAMLADPSEGVHVTDPQRFLGLLVQVPTVTEATLRIESTHRGAYILKKIFGLDRQKLKPQCQILVLNYIVTTTFRNLDHLSTNQSYSRTNLEILTFQTWLPKKNTHNLNT